ncbi:MAG: hypothetical protein ACOZAA_17585 [Pseudomonadota bacterium]
MLGAAHIPNFPPDNWLAETAAFVRQEHNALPKPAWMDKGLTLEMKITDDGDAVIIEEKKLVPKTDGFGGNKIIIESKRVPYEQLANQHGIVKNSNTTS